jgi:hypothetical protein
MILSLLLLACAHRPPEPAARALDVPEEALAWYARAVFANERGDAAERDRALGWMARWDDGALHGFLARDRLWASAADVEAATRRATALAEACQRWPDLPVVRLAASNAQLPCP